MRTVNRSSARFLVGAVAGLVMLPVFGSPALARIDNLEPPMAYGRVPHNLYAYREPYIFTHNVGLLTLQITNVGIIGNPFIDDFSAGWRGGEYLYVSALWIAVSSTGKRPKPQRPKRAIRSRRSRA